MITAQLADTEIAEMLASLNYELSSDPTFWEDRTHLAFVATNLAWSIGNEDASRIIGRDIKGITIPLRSPPIRAAMVADLTGWAKGTVTLFDDNGTGPEAYMLAQYVESLPYTDAETELTDGTLLVSFVTKTFSKVVAFDLKDRQFVERPLKGTLPNDLTAIPEAEVVH